MYMYTEVEPNLSFSFYLKLKAEKPWNVLQLEIELMDNEIQWSRL